MCSHLRRARPTRRMTKATTAALLVAAAVVVGGSVASRNDHAPERPSASERVVIRINKVRAKHHLAPLRYSLSLSRASLRWSRHLVRLGRLEHSSDYRGSYQRAGEVLASGYDNPVPPWLKSPGHRAIILARWARLAGAGRAGNIWTARAARRDP